MSTLTVAVSNSYSGPTPNLATLQGRDAHERAERHSKKEVCMRTALARWSALICLGWLGAILGAGDAVGQVPPLSTIPVPRPDLTEFIGNTKAAKEAAKVLARRCSGTCRWQRRGAACATCHFRAGAAPARRTRSARLLRSPSPSADGVSSNSHPDLTLAARARTTRSPPAISPSASSWTTKIASRLYATQQRGLVAGRAPRDLRRRGRRP